MHNPGIGHALRPEYVLTPAGARLVPAASALLLAATKSSALDTALDKWSLPVLVSLTSGPRRFAELRTLLPRATPRALVLALDSLEAARLVRHVQPRGSAHAVYQLNPRGRRLAHAASDLMGDIGLRLPSPATPDDQSPSASANGSGTASKSA